MARLRFSVLVLLAFLTAFAEAQLSKPTQLVTDHANVLAPEEIEKLEAKLQGLQAIIYLEPSLPEGAVIEDLTRPAVNEWGNGVAIFAFMSDRKIRIEVEPALETKISNDAAKSIIDKQIAPAFRAGEYAKGLLDAVRELRKLLETEYVTTLLGRTLRIEGAENAPRVVRRENPMFPDAALRARITGAVKLEVLIDQAGRVETVTVIEGLPAGLTNAAVNAVKHWRFEPVMANGTAVPALIDVIVAFKL